jgi:hypothetical protein
MREEAHWAKPDRRWTRAARRSLEGPCRRTSPSWQARSTHEVSRLIAEQAQGAPSHGAARSRRPPRALGPVTQRPPPRAHTHPHTPRLHRLQPPGGTRSPRGTGRHPPPPRARPPTVPPNAHPPARSAGLSRVASETTAGAHPAATASPPVSASVACTERHASPARRRHVRCARRCSEQCNMQVCVHRGLARARARATGCAQSARPTLPYDAPRQPPIRTRAHVYLAIVGGPLRHHARARSAAAVRARADTRAALRGAPHRRHHRQSRQWPQSGPHRRMSPSPYSRRPRRASSPRHTQHSKSGGPHCAYPVAMPARTCQDAAPLDNRRALGSAVPLDCQFPEPQKWGCAIERNSRWIWARYLLPSPLLFGVVAKPTSPGLLFANTR